MPAGLARGIAITVAAFAAVIVFDAALHALMAQNPFGGPRPAAEPQVGGIIGWILAKQSEFYREMSATIRAAKSDGSAVWTLLGDFLCLRHLSRRRPRPRQGGDLVLSRRQRGNRAARHRAVVRLGAAAGAGGGGDGCGISPGCSTSTAKTMCSAEKAIEIASYALIAAFGARLVWTKGGGFMRALQAKPAPAMAAAHHHHDHGHDHGIASRPRSRPSPP